MPRLNALHNQYQEFVRSHPEARDDFRDAFEDVLSDAGLTYDQITARVKQWDSLRTKAKKRTADDWQYPEPWQDIHDIVGVRITTFHSTEIPQIIDAITDTFQVHRSVDKAAQTRIAGGFGYGSHHLIVSADERVPALAAYGDMQFEVQIRTVLQHAWAEFEHDIRYKRAASLDPRVDRSFTLAAGLIELADQQFDQIAAIHLPSDRDAHQEQNPDIELSAHTLPGVLAMLLGNRFPESRTGHYAWLLELLQLNEITTVGQLKDLLREEDINAVQEAFKYRFAPGHVRIIDDLLLYRFRHEHLERTRDTGKRPEIRKARLENRLTHLPDVRYA